jgi:hypothetical protein
MLVTPARSAFLMPAADIACAITRLPCAAASYTAAPISSTVNWAASGPSPDDKTPPLVHNLIQSAPAASTSRTRRRIISGPSTTLSGTSMPQSMCSAEPHGIVGSPWPPLWLRMLTAIWHRGPGKYCASMASRTLAGLSPASRMAVTPARNVTRALGTAMSNSIERRVMTRRLKSTPDWLAT